MARAPRRRSTLATLYVRGQAPNGRRTPRGRKRAISIARLARRRKSRSRTELGNVWGGEGKRKKKEAPRDPLFAVVSGEDLTARRSSNGYQSGKNQRTVRATCSLRSLKTTLPGGMVGFAKKNGWGRKKHCRPSGNNRIAPKEALETISATRSLERPKRTRVPRP